MLPFNSGEIYSMNPGEQNQNNFGQPGPIMSSPNDATPSPAPAPISSGQPSANTSRFFGGASRYKGPRTRSASNPEYFSQPAPTPGPIAMSEPLPQYKERKSKAPIFIGIGAIAVIGIIVAAVMLLPGAIQNIGSSGNLADLQILIEKNYNTAINVDSDIKRTQTIEKPWNSTDRELFTTRKATYTKNINEITAFRTELDKYKGIKGKLSNGDDAKVDEKLTKLKTALSERIEAYKQLSEMKTKLMDVYINDGSEDSIQAFKATNQNGKLDNLAKGLKNYYDTYKPNKKLLMDDAACTADYDNCFEVQNKLNEIWQKIENDNSIGEIIAEKSTNFKEKENISLYLSEILSVEEINGEQTDEK